MLQQITPHRGRRTTKFTPANIQKIKDWVAQGMRREDIAKSLDVTVGSLQVTCSRLGISLRRRDNAPRVRVESRGLCFQWSGLRWSFATSAEVSGEISVSPAEPGQRSKRLILLSPLAALGGSELKRQHRI